MIISLNEKSQVMNFVVEFIFGLPFFEGDTFIWKAVLYVLMNVTFIVYDLFITVLVRVYFEKFRPRFKNLLK